jgi:hypothetical protein
VLCCAVLALCGVMSCAVLLCGDDNMMESALGALKAWRFIDPNASAVQVCAALALFCVVCCAVLCLLCVV